ncbi:hypothetical protein TRFO_27001 [Tritrichomonas foetus]|uniref:Initiator binding domain-containing protein n=1 Tax=Tritrichomonas foetus TaxID=1144522 RepID=A0A1J4K398_9EUKA|nr:hypothetical protein TRFO_27001 [Tritrichomonas foetus]|eukprot:OHT05304.1 hypothetical protein TRFO_27001 [Tritrichomonas foetus]
MNGYFLFPKYWNLLSETDRYQYSIMRAEMSSPSNKNQRNKRIETFTDALDKIKKFAIREDNDDWKRCLVCGICWLPEGIAINTHQLRILIFKCKSSINGSLQKMGFNVNLGRTDAANAMVNSIPFLKDNSSELRQWTVRKKSINENDDEIIEEIIKEAVSEEVVSPPPTDLFDGQTDMFLEVAKDISEEYKPSEQKGDAFELDFWNSGLFFNGNPWGCF